MSEFIFTSFPDGKVEQTISRPTLAKRLRGFLPPGDRSRLRAIGEEWGPWRKEADTVDRILERVDKGGVGPKLVVQREKDRDMRAIREVSKVPNLGAAPEIEQIHAAVWRKYDVRSGGLYLCRYIDGTRTVSKHGYLSSSWKGAAEDIFVKSGGMAALIKVGQFIVDETKRGNLKAATVIVDNDIWQPSTGWRVYGGQRHYHTHVDIAGGSACRP